MANLWELSAAEIVRTIRAREVSRREVIQAHLNRIDQVNGSVNAIVEVCADAALAVADAADRDAPSRANLPLDGVPITVKDRFDAEGLKHTEGVRTMAERRSPGDHIVVMRLRAAGAILVGKGNQSEFQTRWNTTNEVYGRTRNPRDPTRSAGGSSGGDAAAVAAGMVALGHGTDYGGSLRIPASWCGVYALRPSNGLVPDVSSLPPFDAPPQNDYFLSFGPLARSVEDLAVALGVLAGPDPADPASVPVSLAPMESARPCRIARMVTDTGATVEPQMEAALDEAARILLDAGYDVVDAAPPRASRAPEVWAEVFGTGLVEINLPFLRQHLGDSTRQIVEATFSRWSLGNDLGKFLASFTERRTIARETALWMEAYPLVLSPVVGIPAPAVDFDETLDANGLAALFDRTRNALWVNALGLPAVSLPNGVQVVARRFRDHEALAAASVLERALPAITIAQPV